MAENSTRVVSGSCCEVQYIWIWTIRILIRPKGKLFLTCVERAISKKSSWWLPKLLEGEKLWLKPQVRMNITSSEIIANTWHCKFGSHNAISVSSKRQFRQSSTIEKISYGRFDVIESCHGNDGINRDFWMHRTQLYWNLLSHSVEKNSYTSSLWIFTERIHWWILLPFWKIMLSNVSFIPVWKQHRTSLII